MTGNSVRQPPHGGTHEWRPRLERWVRDYAPAWIMPLLREVRYRTGRDGDGDQLRAEIADLQHQWKAILDNTPDLGTSGHPRTPHVLFVTGYGLGTGVVTKEPLLMMSLYRRGCRISSLFCDMALPACEFNELGNHRPGAGRWSAGVSREAQLAICQRCASNVRSTYSMFPIELFNYRQFLADDEAERAEAAVRDVGFEAFREFRYEGINVGEEVFASVLRATFKGTVEDTASSRFLVKRYLTSGVMMIHAAEGAYRALQPDCIVMPHGVYITHGIATKVARKMNIPVIIYPGFGGIRRDAIMLSRNETYHRTLVHEPNDIWEHAALTAEQRERTLGYVMSKQSGGVDVVNYHPDPINDAQDLYRTLGIDQSRALVSVYSNVIWDAQIYYDGNAFENILEWMRFVIGELAKNDNVWGVIRIHPAEVKGGLPTRQPFLEEINKWFPTLPENVRVIPPESDLSSYTLAEQSRVAIIYGTKMGLELAVRGIPVIVCGETFCRGKGFSLDITSKDELAELLKRIHTLERLDQTTVERALRYAHYLYFRKMMSFPYLTMADYKTQQGKRIALSSLTDLDAGRDPDLDAICAAIMDQGPTYLTHAREFKPA
jgi:hypothetical protein